MVSGIPPNSSPASSVATSCEGDTEAAQKRPFKISNATPAQLFGVQLLAFTNAALVAAAWGAAATRSGVLALAQLSPAAPAFIIKFLLPFLSAYSTLYVLGPLVRSVTNLIRNSRIARENGLRVKAAQVRMLLLQCVWHLAPVACPPSRALALAC
jgi:hypothetical protein